MLAISAFGTMRSMLTRYINEAMKRARYRTLANGTSFGQIPGLAGVWANEDTQDECRKVLQEVLEEWLILKIRDRDPIPRLGRIALPLRAA
jgi:predicted RNase H-like HicB family nuclease